MRLRKFLIVLVALVLLIGMTPISVLATNDTTESRGFSDMPNNWSTEALQHAVDNGLLIGSDGKLNPKGNLTRAEMATIITRAFNAQVEADLAAFTDVSASQWYAEYIAKAFQMGIMEGSNGLMKPQDQITRQETFVIIARALKLSPVTTMDASFSDADLIASWAKGEIAALVNAGYIQGADGKLNPTGNIKRAEFAQVMKNVIEHYITESGTFTNNFTGNVMVNVADVTLKDSTINGDLIIGDGVGEGDVTLNNVTVTDRVLVRGGGVDSIHIIGGSDIKSLIISRVDGKVRVVTEDGSEVEVVVVEDGSDDVVLEGNFGTVTVVGKNIKVDATKATITDGVVTGDDSEIITEPEAGTPPPVVPVSAISIDKAEMRLVAEGDTGTLEATVSPANATNKTVTWTSSAEDVATVAGGVVTPVAAGTATITATTVDGGKIAEVAVVVYESDSVITTVSGLQTALTGEEVLITIDGTLGEDNRAEGYTIYNVDRAVTIQGIEGAKIFGTFVITSPDVIVDGLALQNRGDAESLDEGNTSHRIGFKVQAENVTLTNNKLTNGLGELAGLSNAIQIRTTEGSQLSEYVLENNEIIDHDHSWGTSWTSTGLLIYEGYSDYKPITVDNLEEYVSILNNNSFVRNSIDFAHMDYQYTNGTLYKFRLPLGRVTSLNENIAEAEALTESHYTEESWSALETALGVAQTVSGNVDAKAAEKDGTYTVDIILARDDLEDAIDGLVAVPAVVATTGVLPVDGTAIEGVQAFTFGFKSLTGDLVQLEMDIYIGDDDNTGVNRNYQNDHLGINLPSGADNVQDWVTAVCVGYDSMDEKYQSIMKAAGYIEGADFADNQAALQSGIFYTDDDDGSGTWTFTLNTDLLAAEKIEFLVAVTDNKGKKWGNNDYTAYPDDFKAYLYDITPDTTGPNLESVLPAEGNVVLEEGENFVLTVEASDDNLYELEIDHSLEGEGTFPEFSVYANEANPYGTDALRTAFVAQGVNVIYNAETQTWTIDFGQAYTDAFIQHGITFYLVLIDKAGNQWGDMYNVTEEMTFAYSVVKRDITVSSLDNRNYYEGDTLAFTIDGLRPNESVTVGMPIFVGTTNGGYPWASNEEVIDGMTGDDIGRNFIGYTDADGQLIVSGTVQADLPEGDLYITLPEYGYTIDNAIKLQYGEHNESVRVGGSEEQ